ncbi:hypothetical protein CS542_04480 [Pedobacter sp. IW39]|nr:hypothetical protein CS542_04480 [Pedobacter sp. IW39]
MVSCPIAARTIKVVFGSITPSCNAIKSSSGLKKNQENNNLKVALLRMVCLANGKYPCSYCPAAFNHQVRIISGAADKSQHFTCTWLNRYYTSYLIFSSCSLV